MIHFELPLKAMTDRQKRGEDGKPQDLENNSLSFEIKTTFPNYLSDPLSSGEKMKNSRRNP